MIRTKILISVILVAALAMVAVAAEDAAKDKPGQGWAERKVLDLLVGDWKSTSTAAKAPGDAKTVALTGTSSVVRALGGHFTLNKSETSDGSTSLTLATYDVQWKCYRMWWFNSGRAMAESQGRWDAKTKTLTWHSEGDNGVASVGKSRYVDDNTVKWSRLIKDPQGEISFREEGKDTRVKQLPKRKATPKVKPADRSAEQKVLNLFVGDWKGTSTAAKAPGDPKAVSLTSTSSIVRAVGGRFIQDSSKVSDGRSSFGLTTYDVRRKCYRTWIFDSQGHASEFRGQWDPKTRTLTMSTEQDNGFTATIEARAVDNDTYEVSAVTKDADGKTVFQAKGKLTRVKKQAKQEGRGSPRPIGPQGGQVCG